LIGHEDVIAAAGRIAGKVVRTPVVYSDAISRLTGADVWLKLDTLQVTGAFKERAAANRRALHTPQEQASASWRCPPATMPRRWRGMRRCSAQGRSS
jgi:threonine dehydratase